MNNAIEQLKREEKKTHKKNPINDINTTFLQTLPKIRKKDNLGRPVLTNIITLDQYCYASNISKHGDYHLPFTSNC